ncbi:sensor histidine kinase [Halostreptopolyspora alba]|uniref:histidine kinase n=1 Tax=Halostreptopolyspora alba TaxID=2487137 RepID=A0A3N0EJ00_9ACTN|nr:sensor histidine kinase [Nocardiopsaceae bacterium YIM 96095]
MDDSAPPPTQRRGPRDWAVDTVLFLAAAGYGVGWSVALVDDPTVPDTRLLWFQVIAALACAAVWLRRRWPVGLALVLVPVATFVDLATGAQLVALFTVAIHRTVRLTLAIGAAMVLSRSGFLVVVDPPDLPQLVLFTVTVNLAVVGWGLFVRHRGQLVLSLEERARRAEAEAHLRAERAQHLAREQIAREMHDVLGHRLSLLSVHAGALEYRPDAPPEEIARAAAVIRESTHQALQDLREVIGVLRAPVGELPQPTLADVRTLVEESRAAGTRVELRERVSGSVPDGVGRAAYRVVQEGLTNAHRHAPGAWVEVTVAGAPGEGVTVEVGNAAPEDGGEATADTGSGAGQGLTGLAERVSLANGTLEHGRTATGGFHLRAWLPWAP